MFPQPYLVLEMFNWTNFSSFLQNGHFSNLKSDTNKHLLCASLCNSVALLFFLCPSRSAGPVTKLAHLFLSALFKKAAVSRKSCTFQMLLAWNGPLIIVVLHALLVPLFLSPFSFFFARNYRDNRNWELRKSLRNVKLWMPSYISSVSKWRLGCKFFLHYFTNHLTPMTALGPSVFIWKSIL